MPAPIKRCGNCVRNDCRKCMGTVEIVGGEACQCGHHELGISEHFRVLRGEPKMSASQQRWAERGTVAN